MREVWSVQVLRHFPVPSELKIKDFNNWTRRLWQDKEKRQEASPGGRGERAGMAGSHPRKAGQLQEKPLLWTSGVLWVWSCGCGAVSGECSVLSQLGAGG